MSLKRKLTCAYTAKDMEDAQNAVLLNNMGINAAAREFGVPRATLGDKLSNRHPLKQGGQIRLSCQTETLLCKLFQTYADWGFGLEPSEVTSLIAGYLEVTNQQALFPNGQPGWRWFSLFKQRWFSFFAQLVL